MAREANILDPIHAELDPRVWEKPSSPKPTLKVKHAHWVKNEVYTVLTGAGYTDIERWLTLVVTGSLTTYQYSNESDFDTSLFVDTAKFPEWSRAEMIALMVEKVDGRLLPGTPFPMQCFVVGEGIKPSDLYKPGLRSGYNLDTQKWIVPPERDRAHDVRAEQGGFYAWALQMADKMERLLRYEPDQALEFWHNIHHKRQRDMRKGKGDFAESNIIYKMLANRKLFPKLEDISGEYIAKTATPTKPPHLREATGKQRCDTCWAFKDGGCDMFGGYKVRAAQTCDDWEATKTSKTAAKVLYNKYEPDPVHPSFGGEEPALPFIFDPDSDIVHLGPAGSYHYQLVDRTPELRDQYPEAGTWTQAPFSANPHHVHGAMHWPSRATKFLGNPRPEQEDEIREALGAPSPTPEENHRWEFNSAVDFNELVQHIWTTVKGGEGITINLYGDPPKTRYGFAPDLSTQTTLPLAHFTPQNVTDFIERFSDRLQDPEKFIGAWVQGDHVVFDVTEGHDDFDTAFQRAWHGHQKSLWDNQINDEIPVRGLDYVQPIGDVIGDE